MTINWTIIDNPAEMFDHITCYRTNNKPDKAWKFKLEDSHFTWCLIRYPLTEGTKLEYIYLLNDWSIGKGAEVFGIDQDDKAMKWANEIVTKNEELRIFIHSFGDRKNDKADL